ncbi:Similar to Gtf2h2: General transcription factor IIH subunit 2 (Rattus norvegicus) [Cotesia congregata]|uniref:Similar to Gtf2h2: General transcription factor IIH subunit 2 (Rattus norvegicus) n=1 Tax=Cotesia congregata TaxID=51543 RepID=A0A8J2MEC9_COTCN|nr:Similar to Gtf2h2: General transcription factor IIH subunit 2 (Rattus norvegicus) [Cotesia congregata]
MNDEDNAKEYRWETGYEKTWESIQENEHKGIDISVAEIIHKAKRKRQIEKSGGARLGMMRHLYLILDISEGIKSPDLKPTRLICTVKVSLLTGGEHGVILDDKHYKEQLNAHVDPPPAAMRLDAALVKMGFPHQTLSSGTDTSISVCMCHADGTDESSKLTNVGYLCPQCLSKHCELPVECKSCGLTLVSAPHLARSYHYLFPVKHFQEVTFDGSTSFCYGCQKKFDDDIDKKVYICEKCTRTFCLDCEIFIHESLHTCPGCASNAEFST